MCFYERIFAAIDHRIGTVQKLFTVDYTIVKLQPDLEPNLNELEQT